MKNMYMCSICGLYKADTSFEVCQDCKDEAKLIKEKAEKWDELNTPKKVLAGKVETVRYGDSDDSGWTNPLVCPICSESVGEITDDDAYFIMSNRCGECGQVIQQKYTSEEIDEWFNERDQNENDN